jgi:hypothetical protein
MFEAAADKEAASDSSKSTRPVTLKPGGWFAGSSSPGVGIRHSQLGFQSPFPWEGLKILRFFFKIAFFCFINFIFQVFSKKFAKISF